MSEYKSKPVPKPLLKLKEKLEQFRKNRSGKKHLPDALWKKAAKLANEISIDLVSKHLRLNYYDLKKWIVKIENIHGGTTDFLELNNVTGSHSELSTLEFENKLGEKLRVGISPGDQGTFIKLIENFMSRSR